MYAVLKSALFELVHYKTVGCISQMLSDICRWGSLIKNLDLTYYSIGYFKKLDASITVTEVLACILLICIKPCSYVIPTKCLCRVGLARKGFFHQLYKNSFQNPTTVTWLNEGFGLVLWLEAILLFNSPLLLCESDRENFSKIRIRSLKVTNLGGTGLYFTPSWKETIFQQSVTAFVFLYG